MSTRVLSTLQGIPYFHSGIGDRDDLLVKVRSDPDGGWYPVVHKGFYYLGTEERYQFAVKGSLTFTVTTTGEILANEEYAYNPRSGQVHIRDQSPPSLWATYLVDETDNDLLKLEEICQIDRDGKVRTQLQTVFLSTQVSGATALRPLVRKVT